MTLRGKYFVQIEGKMEGETTYNEIHLGTTT